jgi:hypothetical protein
VRLVEMTDMCGGPRLVGCTSFSFPYLLFRSLTIFEAGRIGTLPNEILGSET